MEAFSDGIRAGNITGHTGKKLKNIVAIGIGGSFLGPEFVYEALRQEPACKEASAGMTLRFLANVDPIDFHRATDGLDVEETLFIIISKTFSTAETLLNARTCKKHIIHHYKATDENKADILGKHFCAVSTNLKATAEFGIKDENVFGFWDWVGGRYSVSSAVGLLPLNIMYGAKQMNGFMNGMNSGDVHFKETPLEENIPVLLGLVGWYNTYIAGNSSRAILPYCQALVRFAAHIQ